MESLRFKNDATTRKQFFVPGAFAHPAKGHLGMWQTMIERYSQTGDLVLDPMAGIGTSLVAALMGRNVIVNEMEHHFLLPLVRSWDKMRQMPMLGFPIGEVQILWGDARNLTATRPWPYQEIAVQYPKAPDMATLKAIRRALHLPLVDRTFPLRSVDAIVTSPPWEDKTALQDSQWLHSHEAELAERFRQAHAGEKGLPGNTRPENRSTMPSYTRKPVDAIVTSPPYEGTNIGRSESLGDAPFGGPNSQARGVSYTHSVDSIVTSPPYEESFGEGRNSGSRIGSERAFSSAYTPERVGRSDQTNIGNLRNAAYWEAMRQVYAECWRVLRPGGIMALVLKGFTRDGLYVDLPGQTEAMLLEADWQKHDHWRRELWSLSFWRILQKRRDPAAWDDRLMYEDVLAFRKPA